MNNAKQEFLEEVADKQVKCAEISFGYKVCILNVDYSDQDMEDFLLEIDFKYNSGWGSQELFGTIWYKDGTWSSRGEYDGSEWWDYQSVPEIPAKVLKK